MKRTVLFLIAILLVAAPLASAEKTYEKGDQVFSFQAGVSLPGFFWFPYGGPEAGFLGGNDTHLRLGGIGSLSYMVFVSPTLCIGGALGYDFNNSNSGLLLTEIPLWFRLSWIPLQRPKFDLMLSLDLGVAFTRYNKGFFASPAAEVEVQPVFYFNDNWGLGLSASLMGAVEAYFKPEKRQDTAFAAVVPIKLACHYRH